jgi:SpoVK/Ycf46/Vps4 family AAA+-type ATPase
MCGHAVASLSCSLPNKHGEVGVHKAVFLGTTNDPWKLSEPIRSRFDVKIYVPLPDVYER